MKSTEFGETERNLMRTNAGLGKGDKAVNSLINPIDGGLVDSVVIDSHQMNMKETFTKENEFIEVNI